MRTLPSERGAAPQPTYSTTKSGHKVRTMRKLTQYAGSSYGRYVDVAVAALPSETAA